MLFLVPARVRKSVAKGGGEVVLLWVYPPCAGTRKREKVANAHAPPLRKTIEGDSHISNTLASWAMATDMLHTNDNLFLGGRAGIVGNVVVLRGRPPHRVRVQRPMDVAPPPLSIVPEPLDY